MKYVAVLGVILAVSGAAQALTFDVPYQGEVVMKFKNWDVGTLYDVPDGEITGEGTLDGETQLPPVGAYPSGTLGSTEDSWGIFRLDSITDTSGTIDLWNRFTPGRAEVTGIFWGERDVKLNQTTVRIHVDDGPGPDDDDDGIPGEDPNFTDYTRQDIEGVGMSVAFFEDPSNDFDPFPGAGPPPPADIAAARTAPGAFTTATNGALIFSMNSVPGHFASSPNEFFTEFWPDGGPLGANASGGMFAELGKVDLDGDGVADDEGIQNTPEWMRPGADFTFEFTGEPDGTGTWTVISDDPIRAHYVPEPMTMLAVGIALSSLGGYVRRRRRTA